MTLLFDVPHFYFEWKKVYRIIILGFSIMELAIWSEIYFLWILEKINDHIFIYYLLTWFAIPTMITIIACIYFKEKDKEMKMYFSIPIIKHEQNIKKKFRLWIKLNKHNFQDWIITISFIAGVFVPIRLLYYTYIGHIIGVNLGIMTILTLIMYVLIKKQKLGFIGRAFEKRVIRMTSRKLTKYAVIIWFMNVLFYGGLTVLFQFGDTNYNDDLKFILTASYLHSEGVRLDASDTNFIDPNSISYVMILSPDMLKEKELEIFLHPEKMFIIIMSAFNRGSDSIFSYYTAFMFAEETEVFLLFFFERKMYRKGMIRGVSLQELGLGKNLRKFIHQNSYSVIKQ